MQKRLDNCQCRKLCLTNKEDYIIDFVLKVEPSQDMKENFREFFGRELDRFSSLKYSCLENRQKKAEYEDKKRAQAFVVRESREFANQINRAGFDGLD